ncbi:hypothetical protein AV650_10345 [Serratia fonticola]|nr:hypothetical protein AV650_10345 [Serratia fonticola]
MLIYLGLILLSNILVNRITTAKKTQSNSEPTLHNPHLSGNSLNQGVARYFKEHYFYMRSFLNIRFLSGFRKASCLL